MKKKFRLLLCMLIACLCLTGCSDTPADKTTSKTLNDSSSNFLIWLVTANDTVQQNNEDGSLDSFYLENASKLDEYELYNVVMTVSNMIGVEIEGEAYVDATKAWLAALDECGELKITEEPKFTVVEKGAGYKATVELEFEERKATFELVYDEDHVIESLNVSADYSLGEIGTKAGMNTLLGMGTVFGVLVFLAFIISLFKYVPILGDKIKDAFTKKKPAVVEVQDASEPEVAVEVSDDLELVAVITAAIAASEGTSADGFVVRSIKRRASNNW